MTRFKIIMKCDLSPWSRKATTKKGRARAADEVSTATSIHRGSAVTTTTKMYTNVSETV